MTSARRNIAPSSVPFGILLLLLLAMALGGFVGEINACRIAAIAIAASATVTLIAYRMLLHGDDLLAQLLDYSDEADC